MLYIVSRKVNVSIYISNYYHVHNTKIINIDVDNTNVQSLYQKVLGHHKTVAAKVKIDLPKSAFVDIGLAEGPGESGRALASVRIEPVDAGCPVLAQMAGTVVDVDLAVLAAITWGKMRDLDNGGMINCFEPLLGLFMWVFMLNLRYLSMKVNSWTSKNFHHNIMISFQFNLNLNFDVK